jgi:hypothetical protein
VPCGVGSAMRLVRASEGAKRRLFFCALLRVQDTNWVAGNKKEKKSTRVSVSEYTGECVK